MNEQIIPQLPVIRPNKKKRKPKSHGWGAKKKRKHKPQTQTLNIIGKTHPKISIDPGKLGDTNIRNNKHNNNTYQRNHKEIIVPTSLSNITYQEYLKMMTITVEGPPIGWHMLPMKDHYRPALLPSWKELSKQNIPSCILSKMVEGEVISVELHMIAISHKGSRPMNKSDNDSAKHRQDKYSTYDAADHSHSVRVPFSCLEDVLIPFDELEEKTPPSHSAGVVPLSTKWKMGNHRSVNDDHNLHGFEYCVDQYGARYFKRNKQKFYLMGDYLPFPTIITALVHSGRTNHFVHSWSYNCQLQHNLLKQRGPVIGKQTKFKEDLLEEKKRIAMEKEEIRKDSLGLSECVREVGQLLKDIQMAFQQEGLPSNPKRSDWGGWNVFRNSNCRSMQEQAFCTELVRDALQFDKIEEERKIAHYTCEMEHFHYMIIMVSSQMVQDEKLHEQYLQLVHGRAGIHQMIAPFQRVSFFDYYKHFSRCYKLYSGQNKKAEAILALLYAVTDHWLGKMPEKRRYLLALPHVGSKKTAVTLNACGRYKNIGAGADTHCYKCCRYLVKSIWNNKKNTDENTERVFFNLPMNPGNNAK